VNLDKGALDRWITGGDRYQSEGDWRCQGCCHTWTQTVTIEYGTVADELECPECGSIDVEGD
jgi:hypothetical protein